MGKVIDDVLGGRRSSQGGKVAVSGTGSRGRPPLRTVVKARYRTLSSKGVNPARGRASAVMRNLDYMTTRPDASHQRTSREVISADRTVNIQDNPAERRAIEAELTQAKEKYIYHVILSSGDRSMSPKDVELWSKAVLQEQGIDKYHLVIHAGDRGHTEHPHAHILVRSDVRFGREDFFNMRKTGDAEQQFHRQLFRGVEEAWKERSAENAPSSGESIKEIEPDEESNKKRGVDIQFG